MEPRNGTHEDQPRNRPQRRAPRPGPLPGTWSAPAAVSPAAAVHAALAANPGSAVAVIADAAGTGKPAVRDALLAMEKGGTATRVKGGKPGIPDTWTLAGPAQDDAGPEDEQVGQPGDGTVSSPDGPHDDETAGEASQDGAAETASPGQQDADAEASTDAEGGDGTSAAPDPEMEQHGPRDDASAGDEDADGEQGDEAAPDSGNQQDPGDGDGPREDAAPADTDGEAGDAPDPALVSEIIERTGQIKAAADAAEQVLTASGDLRTARPPAPEERRTYGPEHTDRFARTPRGRGKAALCHRSRLRSGFG